MEPTAFLLPVVSLILPAAALPPSRAERSQDAIVTPVAPPVAVPVTRQASSAASSRSGQDS